MAASEARTVVSTVTDGGPPGFDYHSTFGDVYSCVAKGDDGVRRGLWRDYVCINYSPTRVELWVLWNG
ncbi:hypothetical protein FHX46_003901 [Amycolatopsis viridis]|uniref:Uncharacterized protein n=1 Tax=Amycolatopsis viridis TaxID=185678 RepID=A0ABX0SWN0_9PSEU|nr:hypothetical protein [Amycolatopsis viridis]